MKARLFTPMLGASLLALIALPLATVSATEPEQVGASYHGQMGIDTGLGMLEKWCALPNFSFEKQGGIAGWTAKDCNNCHIGASWNPTRDQTDCNKCHTEASAEAATPPTIANCTAVCHKKDIAKRGDQFTAEFDAQDFTGEQEPAAEAADQEAGAEGRGRHRRRGAPGRRPGPRRSRPGRG